MVAPKQLRTTCLQAASGQQMASMYASLVQQRCMHACTQHKASSVISQAGVIGDKQPKTGCSLTLT
jgi:hypothetical protein